MTAMHATKADLKVGSRLKDNDPRNPHRVVVVTQLDFGHNRVGYDAGMRLAWVHIHRIFTDGKTRHQGYNLMDSIGGVSQARLDPT